MARVEIIAFCCTCFSCRYQMTSGSVHNSHVGTSNPGFHGSTTMVTSHLHTTIVNHVKHADSNMTLSNDEVRSFEDEGLDSDVDDLSEIGSGDDGDWDRPDYDEWNNQFIKLAYN